MLTNIECSSIRALELVRRRTVDTYLLAAGSFGCSAASLYASHRFGVNSSEVMWASGATVAISFITTIAAGYRTDANSAARAVCSELEKFQAL